LDANPLKKPIVMSLVCVGLNHQTAPVELREKVAYPEHTLAESLTAVQSLEGVDQAVILSTCNRVEIYAEVAPEHAEGRILVGKILSDHGLGMEYSGQFYSYQGNEAAAHLYAVAGGIDSMVLGETEIFGQVKKAYALAQQQGMTGRELNRLFQRSFAMGKKLRSRTSIQRGATSVGSVAVELAERIFGALNNCQVMLLGAGEMSRTTAQSLLSRGAHSIFVSNRSYDRAVELADEMAGSALRFDDWPSRVADMDIVISSTSAPHLLIHQEQIAAVRRLRRGRPLFMIDIAVPRDIDPLVNEIDDVYLYDIDALRALADEARQQREAQIALCIKMIKEELGISPARESAHSTPHKPRLDPIGGAGAT